MDKYIKTPITEEVTAELKSGDYVYIGCILSERVCLMGYRFKNAKKSRDYILEQCYTANRKFKKGEQICRIKTALS